MASTEVFSYIGFSDFLLAPMSFFLGEFIIWETHSAESVSYHFRALHPKSIFLSPTPSPSEVFILVVYLVGCVCV